MQRLPRSASSSRPSLDDELRRVASAGAGRHVTSVQAGSGRVRNEMHHEPGVQRRHPHVQPLGSLRARRSSPCSRRRSTTSRSSSPTTTRPTTRATSIAEFDDPRLRYVVTARAHGAPRQLGIRAQAGDGRADDGVVRRRRAGARPRSSTSSTRTEEFDADFLLCTDGGVPRSHFPPDEANTLEVPAHTGVTPRHGPAAFYLSGLMTFRPEVQHPSQRLRVRDASSPTRSPRATTGVLPDPRRRVLRVAGRGGAVSRDGSHRPAARGGRTHRRSRGARTWCSRTRGSEKIDQFLSDAVHRPASTRR